MFNDTEGTAPGADFKKPRRQKASAPGRSAQYHWMCLRATRTPRPSPYKA